LIDVFLRTNTRIEDIPAVLSGFTCQRILVRNGGPSQLWQKSGDTWEQTEPGMALYEDLTTEHISFYPYVLDRKNNSSMTIEGDINELSIILTETESKDWLDSMLSHRYLLEDQIDSTVNAIVNKKTIACGTASFSVIDFKNTLNLETELGHRLLDWVNRMIPLGTDQVVICISLK
jgi:hypothetical protein